MSRVDAIHHVIRQVYQAGMAPAEWSRAMADMVSVVGGSRGVLSFRGFDGTGFSVSTGIDAEHTRRLEFEFERRMPGWIKAIPVGTAQRQTSNVSDDEFRRSHIYNEVVRPVGAFYGMVAPLGRAAVPFAHFSAGKEQGAADFSDDDLQIATLLIPHLTMALEVRERLVAADLCGRWAFDLLAQLKVGIILLDDANRPVFVNARAEAIAARCDGLLLSSRTVSASSATDTLNLHAAIERAGTINGAGRDAGEIAIRPDVSIRCHLRRRPPRPALTVSAIPVDRSMVLDCLNVAARVLLTLVEPDGPPGIEPRFADRSFRLTQRESQLANWLASGMSLYDAAGQMGIGVGTARGYLKQVLAKTGTHRQAELVSLILRRGPQ